VTLFIEWAPPGPEEKLELDGVIVTLFIECIPPDEPGADE
jgi:hypothetical protein